MSNINTQSAINQAGNSLRNHSTRSTKKDGLGKQDFLNLFMTQMAHQDPTDPMDSGKMMAQFSQLGVMEQIQNLNGEMKKLNETQSEMSRFQVTNYIGKDVSTPGDKIDFSRGKSSPVNYKLADTVQSLKAKVKNYEGDVIAIRDLDDTSKGRHEFSWDGKSDEGVLMADGNYNVEILATSGDGSTRPLDIYQTFQVSQVEYRNGKPWLKGTNESIPANAVQAVDDKSSKLFDQTDPLPFQMNISPKGIKETLDQG